MKKTENALPKRSLMEDSDQQSTQSAALVGSNDDLLTEILLRLPATSILRFKSVSKHWRWLLSDRCFTLRYDNLSKSPGLYDRDTYVPFDVENPSTPPPFSSLDFYSDRYRIEIMQSCNGLLLCCSYREKNYVRNYYVFNPTTKQFAIVPSLPGVRDVDKPIRFMGLAFHQTDCVHYKIVCVCCVEPDGNLNQIQIYSSDTRKWKISIKSFFANQPTFNKGVYWNGAIHWAPSFQNHLYFDIFAERLRMLPLPGEMMSYKTYTTYFGESRGHLHIIVTNFTENKSLHVNVYEMLSDRSGWFVKYQLELDELPGAFPEMIRNQSYYDFDVVDVVRGDKEEDTFMVLSIPGNIIKYNVHDKSFKKIFSFTNYFYDRCSRVHRYIETLSSF